MDTSILFDWIEYLTTIPGIFWIIVPVAVVIVLQLLPDEIAGGKIFRRSSLWVTALVVTIYVFAIYAAPYFNADLIKGLFSTLIWGVFTKIAWNLAHLTPKEDKKDAEPTEN